MLTIRAEQLDLLQRHAEADFTRRLAALLGVDPGTRSHTAEAAALAHQFGLGTEFEIATVALCRQHYGPDFATRPDLPFAAILAERDVESHLRAAQMLIVLEQPETELP